MASRKIDINLTGKKKPRVVFDPDPAQVQVDDEVFWSNNDPKQAHWPAPVVNGVVDQTGFMDNAIPPDQSSTAFFPSVTVDYQCVLHDNETGTLQIVSTLEAAPVAKKKPKPKKKAASKKGRGAASLLLTLITAGLAHAQPAPVPAPASSSPVLECAPLGQPVIDIPEIPRDAATGILRAVLITADEERNLWIKDSPCQKQYLRYFKGYPLGQPDKWNVDQYKHAGFPEPLPGPTLRARVGDLVQITFLNQIRTKNFSASIDFGEKGLGCYAPKGANVQYPGSDTFPNCIHGSSTSNLHFHGTHTTPSTTGDNVLVQIRPALRKFPPEPDGRLLITEKEVQKPFAEFFKACEANGSPTEWAQMPKQFREQQMGKSSTKPGGWIGDYDKDPVFSAGKLWPVNQRIIENGGWPTYFIGAFPYCFRLPAYDPAKVKMGQAPGTHWYHAHKHGSTEINVANGMTGAFIIEGDYDDKLRKFYEKSNEHPTWGLKERVLVIQQLSTLPGIVTGGGGAPALSVNGRQQPTVTMRPGEVQLWRFVNGASRDMVSLCPVSGLPWRQTAQDGVQFSQDQYAAGDPNARIDLAAANRADLLVQAPATASTPFQLAIVTGVAPPGTDACKKPSATLLTVVVDAKLPAAQPQMPFIDKDSFPKRPDFLDEIPESAVRIRRDVVFATFGNAPPPAPRVAPPNNSHYIDSRQFEDRRVDQSMLLDTIEEWKVLNASTGIAHPFHIHVNPFLVTEVFSPTTAPATGPCAIDPMKPETWKPCAPSGRPGWWDVFAIPVGKSVALDASVCTVKEKCPEQIRQWVRCTPKGTTTSCSVMIPGYFKMRTRFSDFPGQFVLHCHILIHEDRGMMQLVEVVPNSTIYGHH